MKSYLIILFISLTTISINAQIPISEIIGLLELSLPNDSTSMYMGKRQINDSFYSSSERNHNVVIGYKAASVPEEGDNSVIIGHRAAENILSFSGSVIIGDHVAEETKTIDNSVILGRSATENTSLIQSSIVIGESAGYYSDTIIGATFLGYEAGNSLGENSKNTAIGHESSKSSRGKSNSYLGYQSAYSSRGDSNVGIGAYNSEYQQGRRNTSIGADAHVDSEGEGNSSIGFGAGTRLNGNYNLSLGYNSGKDTKGNNNIYIGEESGNGIKGSNNIVLGEYQIDTMSNQFVVSDTNSSPLIAIDRGGKQSRFNTEDFFISSSSSESPTHFLSYKDKNLSSYVNITGKTGLGLYTKLFDTDYGFNLEYDAIVNKLNLKTSGFIGAGSKMTWGSNGNVGINTEFPQELLHVAGDSRIDGEQEVEKLIAKGTTGEFGIITSEPSLNNSNLYLQANNNIVLELDKNGGSTSSFSVKTGANTILELLENGNLSVDGTLVHTSDINRKHDINPVNPNDILEKVQALDIATWKYKGATENHIGPMAQDFYAAFGLGAGETTIATVDADGVALAAIKALAAENESLKKIIKSIQLELTEIKKFFNEN